MSGLRSSAAVALLGAIGVAALLLGTASATGPAADPPAGSAVPAQPALADVPRAAVPPTVPVPAPDAEPVAATAFRIPLLGIESPVVPLVLAADRRLDPPRDPAIVGWYSGSAVPGRQGPAVMTGHVDSLHGPGVFHRLAGVPPGTTIEVDLSDGSTVRFRVVSVLRTGKDDFPTDAVYGPVPVPVLHVISCTGRFDVASLTYVDNVIVTAVPA